MKKSVEDVVKILESKSKEDLDYIYKNRPLPPLRAESSMDFWWEKVKDLDVPQPRTIRVSTDEISMAKMMDGAECPNLDQMKKAVEQIGLPCFMRNNITSNKHSWKHACWLENLEDLDRHVYSITEFTFMITLAGEMRIDSMYFREFLDLEKVGFTAFDGDMPINKEVRCFIHDGSVECIHPYWFKEVFDQEIEYAVESLKHKTKMESWMKKAESGEKINPKETIDYKKQVDIFPPNWEKMLEKSNVLSKQDLDIINSHLGKIMPIFNGYWSVDFTKGNDGTWYLIDMARGELSYHYDKCKLAPTGEIPE